MKNLATLMSPATGVLRCDATVTGSCCCCAAAAEDDDDGDGDGGDDAADKGGDDGKAITAAGVACSTGMSTSLERRSGFVVSAGKEREGKEEQCVLQTIQARKWRQKVF